MRKPWTPLQIRELPSVSILAADPSIAAFGLVLLEIDRGQAHVRNAKRISTDIIGSQGWESNFDRAEDLYIDLKGTIDDWLFDYDWPAALWAVHEAPPAGGGRVQRPESSILGGREFRRACATYSINQDNLVTPQAMKKLITGNHLAPKQDVAKSIKELLPQIHGSHLITNEATRDALGIALYSAHRMKGS